MNTLYVDPFAGIAGDMFCAALIDLGVPLEAITAPLHRLDLPGWSARVETVRRGALAARHFVVSVEAEGHPHRRWSDIRTRIEAADLPDRARSRALRVFSRLADAEGAVHGMPPEDVSFHEVGAVDSIVDIVGACLALEFLDIDRIVSGPPPLASGAIHSAHGLLPLPAPATVALLRGWPVRTGVEGMEQVTPTGAALLAALAEPGPIPAMLLRGTGAGAGTRDLNDRPNVLRVLWGEERLASSPLTVEVIEAQVDDMPGEQVPALIDALLAAGALDALSVPVMMKKGRPGLLFRALAEPARATQVEDAMLRHSTTFGVRRYPTSRRVLERWHEPVETRYGTVRVKIGALNGLAIRAAPEHEDVKELAALAQVPEHQVHSAALQAWQARNQESTTGAP